MTRLAWCFDEWKVAFGRQDAPSTSARMFTADPHRLAIVEHTARGTTEAREVTFDGREPRRAQAPARKWLRGAVEAGSAVVLHLDGALVTLDLETLRFSAPIDHDPLATEMALGSGIDRVYVGAKGMLKRTWVVHLTRGVIQELAVSPPTFVLARPEHPGEELWLDSELGTISAAQIDRDGRVAALRSLGALPEPFAGFVAAGDVVLAVSGDRARHPMPFAYSTPPLRDIARVEAEPSGLRVVARHRSSTLSAVLGTTPAGELVALDAQGKTAVVLLDRETLATRARRAMRQHGVYDLAALAGASRVVAFRRFEKVDRLVCLRWADAPPPEPAVADARLTPLVAA